MAKLKSTLPNMLMSLTGICLIAGAALATVNTLTTAPIVASKAAKLENAIREVTPEFNNNPSAEAYKGVTADGDSLIIYPAKMDGNLVGVAVESNTKKGFSGEIKVIVGLDKEGKLLNYSVLQHAETPGLGSKMQEWFRADKNKQNVLGKNLAQGPLNVTKDGGDVDAITAATISSRAFLNAVNRAYSAYDNNGQHDGTTSATEQDNSKSDKKGGSHE